MVVRPGTAHTCEREIRVGVNTFPSKGLWKTLFVIGCQIRLSDSPFTIEKLLASWC